jgi:signal peptidase I
VVFKEPGRRTYAVKRIIGSPGDTISFKDESVSINGQPLNESYLQGDARTIWTAPGDGWLMVGKDRYFVLGDNRSNSEDSRIYGTVAKRQIVGLIRAKK